MIDYGNKKQNFDSYYAKEIDGQVVDDDPFSRDREVAQFDRLHKAPNERVRTELAQNAINGLDNPKQDASVQGLSMRNRDELRNPL